MRRPRLMVLVLVLAWSLAAAAALIACSLTIESGIEAHYKNQGDEEPIEPTPTPAARQYGG